MRLPIGSLLALTVLSLAPAGRTEAIDHENVGSDMIALDDGGRVWLWDEEMPGNGCAWVELETFTGALMMDWTRNSSGSFVGAIPTDKAVHIVTFLPETRTFTELAEYPLPTTDFVDFEVGGQTGPFWLRLTSGEFWFGRFVGSEFVWFGPCDGPAEPTNMQPRSFGATKSDFR